MKIKALFLFLVTAILFGCTEPNPPINKSLSVALSGSTSAALAADSTYTFTATCTNQEGQKPTSQQLVCVLETTDSLYVLSQTSDKGAISDSMALQVSFSELPDLEWQRDSATRIIGKLVYSGICAQQEFRKELPIALLYKPNKPSLTVDTIMRNDKMDVQLHFSAAGTTRYVITYYGLNDLMLDDVAIHKDTSNYLIQNLDPTQRYSIRITAFNDYGSNESESVYVGKESNTLIMYVTKVGNNLSYHFKQGVSLVYDLNIKSVAIYNVTSNAVPEIDNIQAGIGDSIDISSLPVGFHILSVVLEDGRVFNGRFSKQ